MATGSPVCPRCVRRTRALVAFFATKQNPFLTFFPFLPLYLSNNKPGWNLQLTCSSLVSPTFSVWKKKKKGRYLFQLLVCWEPEVTELLLWFYEGVLVLPLDESPLPDQDWAGAWRHRAGQHIQSILGCLPWGRQHKMTGRAFTAKPRQCFSLGGLVGDSPLQPNRNFLWGHPHEHDGPILTLLTVFHSLPIRECERSFLRCCRKKTCWYFSLEKQALEIHTWVSNEAFLIATGVHKPKVDLTFRQPV